MKFLKSFGQFWYEFIIGDDWKIAAAVVIALVVVFALLKADLLSDAALTLVGGAAVDHRVRGEPGDRRTTEVPRLTGT